MQKFSLQSIKRQAGIQDATFLEYVTGKQLADRKEVFCISAIEDVPSDLTKDGKQWQLTVHYPILEADGTVTSETNYLSLGHNKVRDREMEAYKKILDENKGELIHSSCMNIHQYRNTNRIAYVLGSAIDEDGNFMCDCDTHNAK